MRRFFNTAGPCRPDDQYMLPSVARLENVHELIAAKSYFVLHAPRQTGKTTSLTALCQELTASGAYAALLLICEQGQTFEDPQSAESVVLASLRDSAVLDLPEELQPPRAAFADDSLPTGHRLRHVLSSWAQSCPRPLVVVFDEIDSLRGQSLISVLRQLRAGYAARPRGFPQSVVLCGLRDVRDYKVASGGDPSGDDTRRIDTARLGTSSPFNVIAKSRIQRVIEPIFGGRAHQANMPCVASSKPIEEAGMMIAAVQGLISPRAARATAPALYTAA